VINVLFDELCISRCRQHYRHQHQFIGGDDINQTVHAVFAALLWHTPVLREDVERYGEVFNAVYLTIQRSRYSDSVNTEVSSVRVVISDESALVN